MKQKEKIIKICNADIIMTLQRSKYQYPLKSIYRPIDTIMNKIKRKNVSLNLKFLFTTVYPP